MDPWEFAFALAGLVATVLGGAWRVVVAFTGLRESLTQQMVATNNTMLARLQLSEDNAERQLRDIVARLDARALELERELSGFRAYSERQFLSKDVFNELTKMASVERAQTKAEMMDRFNRIDDKLNGKRI